MPDDDDREDNPFEDHDEEHGPDPIRDLLQRIFGMPSPEQVEEMQKDLANETAAFELARETVLRAATILVPKEGSRPFFVNVLREKFFNPLLGNPLMPRSHVEKLSAALAAETGQTRESGKPDQPNRPEVWGDVLYDKWFEHVAEHIGRYLWLQLSGEAKEKEAAVEEMLPLLERFGPPLLRTHRFFTSPDDDGEMPSPLKAATECAAETLKEDFYAKAKELGVL